MRLHFRLNGPRMNGVTCTRTTLALLFLAFLLLVSPASKAETHWLSQIERAFAYLATKIDKEKTIYISTPTDATQEGRYFPFIHTDVKQALIEAAGNQGYSVSDVFPDSDIWLKTKFHVRKNVLRLISSLHDINSSKVIGSKTVYIPENQLPVYWKDRNLRDIATELAVKLGKKLSPQQLSITVGEFSGGGSDSDAYVSEFSNVIRGYVLEALGNLDIFSVRKSDAAGSDTRQLKGQFQIMGNEELLLRLSIYEPTSGIEIANVSTRFAIESIPPGMSILPDNVEVAAKSNDPPTVEGKAGTRKREISIWTNHEDLTYRNGDELVLHVRPHTDLYIRIYYIQSDGLICQIFPLISSDTGFVNKNQVRTIGGAGSGIRYRITDDTLGQETIKVFSSYGPIDDSGLPLEYSSNTRHNCVTSNYNDLKRALTRGLKLEYEIRPAAEVKILVAR